MGLSEKAEDNRAWADRRGRHVYLIMNLSWSLTAPTSSLHYSMINNITYAAKHFIKMCQIDKIRNKIADVLYLLIIDHQLTDTARRQGLQ